MNGREAPGADFPSPIGQLQHGGFTKALLDEFGDPDRRRQPQRPDHHYWPRHLCGESRFGPNLWRTNPGNRMASLSSSISTADRCYDFPL